MGQSCGCVVVVLVEAVLGVVVAWWEVVVDGICIFYTRNSIFEFYRCLAKQQRTL
jgi:hypothetical protein